MWALGVTIYQICTGEHPFNIEDEVSFRDDALHANVDISRLDAYPRIAQVVQQLLCEKPADRWNAHEVLVHAQYDFAVEIQRVWRGHVIRQEYRRVISKVVQIQAHIKGHLVTRTSGRCGATAAETLQFAFNPPFVASCAAAPSKGTSAPSRSVKPTSCAAQGVRHTFHSARMSSSASRSCEGFWYANGTQGCAGPLR